MPISVHWGTKVITVPKDYLTFVSGTTYQLNIDGFRLQLKNLEDDFEGMPYLDTHSHTAPITLSGSTYSRFIEIINGYTITFEEGLYQVNLSGANNNIVDVLNRNSVSVVANNSSGLISSDQLEYSSFQNRITVDTVLGTSGTDYPTGTVRSPVNNLPDALIIAQQTGISKIFFKNSHTISSGLNVSGLEFVGEAPSRVTLTFEDNVTMYGLELFDCQVEGYIGSIAGMNDCHLLDIIGTSNLPSGEMNIHDCIIEGTVKLSSGLGAEIQIFNCKSGVAGQFTPTLDINGASGNILVRDYTGGIKLTNMTSGNRVSTDFMSGQIIFDESCTDAEVTVRGLCKIINNASDNPNFILTDEVTITAAEVQEIAGAVWDKTTIDHVLTGTFGQKVGKKLLTTSKFIGLK